MSWNPLPVTAYFHLDRVFLTVIDQRNSVALLRNAVHRHTRLATPARDLLDDKVVDSLPIAIVSLELLPISREAPCNMQDRAPTYRAGPLAGEASRFRIVAIARRGLILNASAKVNVNMSGHRKNASWEAALGSDDPERITVMAVRVLADQAFTRAAGAPLRVGNHVRLLKDARENYPAWLDAIDRAQCHIHLENYILYNDSTGRRFADALLEKAQTGVRVRLIYDWLGCFGKASRAFWRRLRAGGVDVRCYNPPRLDSPFGWLSRDHRKMLAVDGEVGFVSGLCIGRRWEGLPGKGIEPWRDTGVEVRGAAVADIEQAFAQVWAMLGEPLPEPERVSRDQLDPAGDSRVRVVATVPATAGLLRVDLLVTTLARKRLWLTDAYYAGTAAYVQALQAIARDGVDVRLLVPNATDIPLLKPLSRAGYRPLLEAGVRVFEWNGAMLHAKTAVADGHWARVGSSNLNLASWLGNCELDVIIEDHAFARAMEAMYLDDLTNTTEVVLIAKHRAYAPGAPHHGRRALTRGGGSARRAAAGMVRIGNTAGAAFTGRRVLQPVEARLMATVGASLLLTAAVVAVFPRLLAYLLTLLLGWLGGALLYRGYRLHRRLPTSPP